MEVSDSKLSMTDVADTQQLLRLNQSIPSPKAAPFKQWLAKVDHERLQEIQDPAMSLDRVGKPATNSKITGRKNRQE